MILRVTARTNRWLVVDDEAILVLAGTPGTVLGIRVVDRHERERAEWQLHNSGPVPARFRPDYRPLLTVRWDAALIHEIGTAAHTEIGPSEEDCITEGDVSYLEAYEPAATLAAVADLARELRARPPLKLDECATSIGWTDGDGWGHDGSSASDFFKSGLYLGPSRYGIEPIFPVRVSTDEDGVVIAECPALPGVVSQGETRESALDHLREAILAALST